MAARPEQTERVHSPVAWLEAHASVPPSIVDRLAGRRRLSEHEREELLSEFLTHLIRDDYRVLRRFRGTSSVATYLTRVAERLLLDLRTKAWGKWRPSRLARRSGPLAMAFERLVLRDGHSASHAHEMLLCRTGATISGELEGQVLRRRPTFPRRFVSLDEVERRPSAAPDPWRALLEEGSDLAGAELGRRLERALRALPAADQVLIRMRHEQGLKVCQIATMLQTDVGRLYRRLAAVHETIRQALSTDGVTARDAVAMLDEPTVRIPNVFRSLGSLPDAGSRCA